MWNLKYDTNETFTKQKWTHTENRLVIPKVGRGGKRKDWDWQMQSVIYRMISSKDLL